MARRIDLFTLRVAAMAITIAACAPAAVPSAHPPPSAAAASPGPTSRPTPTIAPVIATPPPGTTAWPTRFDVEMHGTYWSAPPVRIPFGITVDEAGWYSGHLHDTFVDLQRFDGITPHQFPNRMLGFGDPDHVRGGGGDVDVAGLTPDAAFDILAGRASLKTGNRATQALFGLHGARLDLHSVTSSNPLFGNGSDNFGLGPELDIRLVLLPRDGRLLVVAVLAAPGDLDGAWDQALPILETVRLAS
jgi:hypothetical protein